MTRWQDNYLTCRGKWLTDHQKDILIHGPETKGEEMLLSHMEANWKFEKMLLEEGFYKT